MLNRLRMAGEFLRNKDQAYATAVQDAIIKHLPEKMVTPAFAVAGAPLTMRPTFNPNDNKLLGHAANAAMVGSSALVRYGIPIAGAKMAADGIGALYNAAAQTPVFGQNPADEQDSNLMIRYA